MSAFFRHGERFKRIRRRIEFYGCVQAVGFRYRAMHAARLYGATGWVRNEPYGSVTMEIQGTADQIDQVVESLKNDDYIRIDHMESREIPYDNDERTFRVAY